MPPSPRRTPALTVEQILSWLARHGTRRNREGMERFAISGTKTFGVSMAGMRPLVRRIGRDHALALALWQTGWLEARLLASFVDDPALVTRAQLEAWVVDFDNWAVCDSVCLHLFDRTPHAWPVRGLSAVDRRGCPARADLSAGRRAPACAISSPPVAFRAAALA